MPLYRYNGSILRVGNALAKSEACCCDCECPSECSYGVSIVVEDPDLTEGVAVEAEIDSTTSCTTPCDDGDVLVREVYEGNPPFGSEAVAIVNRYETNTIVYNGVNAQGQVVHSQEGPNDGLDTRTGESVTNFFCDPTDKQWYVVCVYRATQAISTGPANGNLWAKQQYTDLQYSNIIPFGPPCSASLDEVTVVYEQTDGVPGVTIDGEHYELTEIMDVRQCRVLDGNNEYQDCNDYLDPSFPKFTVRLFRLAGC